MGFTVAWGYSLDTGLSGGQSSDKSGTQFATELVHNGGTGARPNKDGLSATAYPSGVMGSLVEITERFPLIIWRREYREDSAGAGRQRGGLGQVLELSSSESAPVSLFASLRPYPPPGAWSRGRVRRRNRLTDPDLRG